ncbi:hypothetical protein [Salinisphaera sp.]|uniref:hypothetical protein n=1 Tax=Salinisphaera sp. TaxID=1914330 RepID=UPI002D76F966|nr:hypothetical protein [Salinisphaera sp.]HET7314174.1 hypothetical protein [Salinisphaera sp.]
MFTRANGTLIAVGALVAGMAGSAHASVIHTDLDQTLSDTPYTLSLGADSAFALRSVDDGSGGHDLALSTRGGGQVAGSSLFGSYEYIDKFAAGDEIGDTTADFISTSPAGTYADIPTANDLDTPYIGLSYLVNGLTHFAYIGFVQSVDGFSLADYGYETEAGQAITAGATGTANDVPAPGGLFGAVALAGLALIGFSRWRMSD